MEDNLTLIAFACALATIVLLFIVISQRGTIIQLKQSIQTEAEKRLAKWKETELLQLQEQERNMAVRVAYSELQEWKSEEEANIRQDAITRSQAVILGKVTEQVIPFHQAFPYNPKDVRFIGSPIDLIVFDGASEGDVDRIILLEVKSGNSSLSTRQRRIRDAVEEGRVVWQELRL